MKPAADTPIVCASKETYTTYDAANFVARQQNRRKRGTVVQVYRCPECGDYHLRGAQWGRVRR